MVVESLTRRQINWGGNMDKVIVCKDCGKEFTFTEGEQAFYAERGFHEPVRCKACRDARKALKEQKEQAAGSEQAPEA